MQRTRTAKSAGTNPGDPWREDRPRQGGSRHLPPLVSACCLFAVALAVRLLPWRSVYFSEHVQFFGNDAYYHMRRALYSLAQFPASLSHDPYINYPDGAQPIWTPFFDGFVALVLLPFRDRSQDELEAIAVLIPPVLGALTVVTLYGLARRHFGAGVAMLAGALLSVLSGHFWYSQLGFIDHHVAVALLSTLLLASALYVIEDATRGARPRGTLGVGPPLCGGALGAMLLMWPGALLHVGLVELGLLAALLSRRSAAEAVPVAWQLALTHGFACALVAPFCLGADWAQWSAFSPVVLSDFQPWLFAAATVWSVLCALLWSRWPALGDRATPRVASALALILALVGSSLAIWSELIVGGVEAWEWISRSDRFQALVAESNPLLTVQGEFSTGVATRRLSGFVLCAPIFLLVGLVRARRRRDWPLGFTLAWTLGLGLATLAQKRFFNSASIALALLFALAIAWSHEALSHRLRRLAHARALSAAAIAALCLPLLLPTLRPYQAHLRDLSSESEASILRRPSVLQKYAAGETARWIARNTPPTSGWLEPDARPEYAIMAPWGLGHLIEYLGRRPTVSNNFGDDIGAENFVFGQRYFAGTEGEAAGILELVGARYVIAQKNARFLAEPAGRSAMLSRLYDLDGSEGLLQRRVPGQDGAEEVRVPPLRRHRLLFESLPMSNGTATEPASQAYYKVFEYVPGARIVGRAPAGSVIESSLALRTNRGRRILYRARARADDLGRYQLRVPYATDATGREQVRALGRYTLSCGLEEIPVAVPEAMVQGDGEIPGPDLCSGAIRENE